MIGLIVAMTADGVIGLDGAIPWRYPSDLRRFKEITNGSTVVMGRKTWESIPAKYRPLPGRRNFVLTRTCHGEMAPGVPCYPTIDEAVAVASGLHMSPSIWIIGGAHVYAVALRQVEVDVIDITLVPDVIDAASATVFPYLNLDRFDVGPITHYASTEGDGLRHQILTRKA